MSYLVVHCQNQKILLIFEFPRQKFCLLQRSAVLTRLDPSCLGCEVGCMISRTRLNKRSM